MFYYAIRLNNIYWLGPTNTMYDSNMRPVSFLGPTKNSAILISQNMMTEEQYEEMQKMAEEHGGKIIVMEEKTNADLILEEAFPNYNKDKVNSKKITRKNNYTFNEKSTFGEISYDDNDLEDESEGESDDDDEEEELGRGVI